MDNYKVPAYPISRADIIRDGGYYDVNGLWNSIRVLGDGYLARHRVETFIFRETSDNRLEVFLRMYNDGTYRLPGGSTTKGVSDKVQAILECQEEARIKVKDIEYTGVHYVKMNTKKLNNNDPNLVHWDGSYNDVYAGFYNGPYTGEVKDLDQDNDMYKNGKFYIIDDELLSHIIPEHKPIFDRLKQVGILEDTEVDNGSKEATSTIDDKAIELCVFAGNFLTRCVDNTVSINIVPHKKMEDMYAVASYQCYSEENMLKFIALLNELNNTTVMRERYKDDNFGVIIPSKDAYNGTLYLKSGITSVSENAALHDDKDPIFTAKPEEDWLDTILQQDDSPEHRKKLVDLGIEPDSDLPIGEAVMIAERIISSCTEGVISVNEKYIFSEKDGFYNFDKWESGESNILLITGLSGSGKTTKAKALMKQYDAKYIQLDEFQCYNNNKGKKDSTTSRLISIYLKENPHSIDPAKFTELTAEDFPDYFDPFFDWLIERLSSDQDNRYIIEGLHICLYVPYNTIREYPLYCINTSMTKSIIRHWIRDGWSFRDFLKHGLADIDLFKEWEKQYSSFKDSIDESYIEEGQLLPRVDKRKLADEEYVKKLIKDINNTPDEIYKKRTNVQVLLTIAWLSSMLTVVTIPIGFLLFAICEKINKVHTKDSEKKNLIEAIDKYIEKLRKTDNSDEAKKIIKKLEHNKKVIQMNGKNTSTNKPSLFVNDYMKINGVYFPSLAAMYHNGNTSASTIKKYLEKWQQPVNNKTLYFDSFIEEIIARGFNEQKMIQYIKIHEGDGNSIVKDIEKSSIKSVLQGKTLTTIVDIDSECIFYCSEDKCCYSLNLDHEDNFKKLSLIQVLQASYKGYDELEKILKYSIDESYIEEKSEEYGLPVKNKYPMPDKKHVYSAIKFFNYVDKEDEKELAENIKKKMKQYKINSSHVGENNRLKNYL